MKKTLFGTAAALILSSGVVFADTAAAPTTDMVPQMSAQDVDSGMSGAGDIVVPVLAAIIILLALGGDSGKR